MGTYIDPDLESIIAADPDWVFILNTDEGIHLDLERLGIRYISYGNDNISDIRACIEQIGHIVDRKDKAMKITTQLDNLCYEVREKFYGVERKTVALVVGRNPGRLPHLGGECRASAGRVRRVRRGVDQASWT